MLRSREGAAAFGINHLAIYIFYLRMQKSPQHPRYILKSGMESRRFNCLWLGFSSREFHKQQTDLTYAMNMHNSADSTCRLIKICSYIHDVFPHSEAITIEEVGFVLQKIETTRPHKHDYLC